MRVNPNPVPDLLAALSRTRQDTQDALFQLSSGRKVNEPSDDPAAAALLIDNHDRTTFVTRYQQSLTSMQGQYQTADSTLNSVVLALQRALTLGVQGGKRNPVRSGSGIHRQRAARHSGPAAVSGQHYVSGTISVCRHENGHVAVCRRLNYSLGCALRRQ